MLNIISRQGNANQNHNEISLYTYQDGYNNNKKINVGEDMEKLEPSYIVGGNVKQ